MKDEPRGISERENSRGESTPVIEIENLTKVYSNGFTAISNLTLNIGKGIFALLGPNGSGKTTLIGILMGALRPTSGRVKIVGYDLSRISREIKKNIGYQPENPGLYQDLTGKEFLDYMGRLSGLSGGAVRNKVEEMLEWADLARWKNAKIRTYSSGMKQKLAFIQSLINDPRILLLDEPTKGLDPVAREKILEMVKRVSSSNKTVIFATHLLAEVEYIASRVAIIDRGRLLIEGELGKLTQEKDLFSIYKDAFIGGRGKD